MMFIHLKFIRINPYKGNYSILKLKERVYLCIYGIILYKYGGLIEMIKKEMIDNFGIDRKTLNNWENNAESKRHILYKTLEALPADYVDNIKQQIKDKKENDRLLEE